MSINYKIQKYETKLKYYISLKQTGGTQYDVGNTVRVIGTAYTVKKDEDANKFMNSIGKIEAIYGDNIVNVKFDNGESQYFTTDNIQLVTSDVYVTSTQPTISKTTTKETHSIKNGEISLEQMKTKYKLKDNCLFFYKPLESKFPPHQLSDLEHVLNAPLEITILDKCVAYIKSV